MAALGCVGYDLVFRPELSCIRRGQRRYRRCAPLASRRTIILGQPRHSSISVSSRLDAGTHGLSSSNAVFSPHLRHTPTPELVTIAFNFLKPPRTLIIPTRTYAHAPSPRLCIPADGDLNLAALGFMDTFGHAGDQLVLVPETLWMPSEQRCCRRCELLTAGLSVVVGILRHTPSCSSGERDVSLLLISDDYIVSYGAVLFVFKDGDVEKGLCSSRLVSMAR
ncbi:hypothetical protein BDZ89DRAFT_1167707 [Hymenopellis radicata]|nr:hypothetical protein BDZ89DRAFT_1167703 [Hymenopellis radicata]KAF9010428.1 hypothetical protein BDZ89DRAFT_1167707 [Hymenopellis radicata]